MNAALSAFMGFSERGKLFLLTFALTLITVFISLAFAGLSPTLLLVAPSIFFLLTVTKDVWSGEGSGGGGKSKIQLASLGVAVVALGANQKFAEPLLKPVLEQLPGLKENLPAAAPTTAGLVFITAVVFIVNYFARDTTAMRAHQNSLAKDFPEKGYKERLKSFSEALLDELSRIDRESNWSSEKFVALDAEVEVQSGSKRLRRVTDLLTAIRSDRRSRVFLVLGDPGSGKSVALRKLCRDLLKEVVQAGKVPLYFNLREWESDKPWSEENPPTVAQLSDFVISNLQARLDLYSNEFLTKYYKKMVEDGRVFFVLDSFDEIPAVLDVSEQSWLIERLSEVIRQFLASGHKSRGILASRIFRRPTDKFDARTVLEIRPFTENKIIDFLQKSLFYDEALVSLLFNQRQDLIPVARNPFTAALLSKYATDHNNTLPLNQAELYSSYVEQRLAACAEKLAKKELTDGRVVACAIDIADLMFTTWSLGLEASVRELRDKLPQYPVEDIIDVLTYARLGRLGAGDEHRFSFVHRRFNEYFVVQRLKEQPDRVPADSIPTDSRWRDALVLYCGVAEEARARAIAEFCWGEISRIADRTVDMSDPQYMRAVHCLRFLKEAFRARLGCVDAFRDELARYIGGQITDGQNLLSQKIAVEAVGLLKPEDVETTLIKALDIQNQWIDETALKSCHYLSRLGDDLRRKLRRSIDNMSTSLFLSRRKELMLSLKLSNVLSDLRSFCRWRLVHIYCRVASFVLLFLLSPMSAVFVALMLFLEKYLLMVMRGGASGKEKLGDAPAPPRHRRPVMPTMFSLVLWMAYGILLAGRINLPGIGNILFSPLRGSEDILLSAATFLPPTALTSLCVCGLLLAIPWYKLYYYWREWVGFVLHSKRKILEIVAMAAGFILVCSAAIMLLAYLGEIVMGVVLGGLSLAGFLGFINTLVKYLLARRRDKKLLAKPQNPDTLTREIISERLNEFATPEGELQYVRFLQEAKVKPGGDWPGGQIPKPSNVEAATLLAKLEEQWLGLDR